MGTTYNMQPFLRGPFSTWSANFALLQIDAKKLEAQMSYARGNEAIKSSGGEFSWLFVAPNEIFETVVHTWEPYESVASRLATKVKEVKGAVIDANAISGAATNTYKSVSTGKSTSTTDFTNSAISGASVSVPQFKVDTSLIYTDTDRRKYSLLFDLMDLNGDPQTSIIDPIMKLKELSCAEMTDDLTGIDFPNIFSVRTVGSDIININNAALVSVGARWQGPYIRNLPTRCELTLDFTDLEPLYRISFSNGGICRTS